MNEFESHGKRKEEQEGGRGGGWPVKNGGAKAVDTIDGDMSTGKLN